ncbi:hypothetical protein B14911_19985 [Bacillus sp. NRRL B-14911]|nr:hypothetical protein B14911_19985 [Bacillus sp. NRRL B-14911]
MNNLFFIPSTPSVSFHQLCASCLLTGIPRSEGEAWQAGQQPRLECRLANRIALSLLSHYEYMRQPPGI